MEGHHHHAQRDVQIVFVEVPSAGSNKTLREVKPLPFQRNHPSHWRPATRPPNRKAEGFRRMLDSFERQDRVVREFMQPNGALLKQWFASRVWGPLRAQKPPW